MLEGNVVVAPAVLIGAAWACLARRRGYEIWTATVGLVGIAHIAVVLALTFFPLPVQTEVLEEGRSARLAANNLIPLASLAEAVATGRYPAVLHQTVGNFVMLAPIAIYGQVLWPRLRAWHKVLLAGFVLSCLIEATQLTISAILGYTYKIADIDDVIFNTGGVVAAYVVLKALARLFGEGASHTGPTLDPLR